jgi:hypothetical protein
MARMIALRDRGPALLALLTIVWPTVSLADPPPRKEQCFDAYEQAQRLRKDYKLRAAHAQLLTCAADSCPAFVRQDCSKWLAEVETSTPTVVVLAKHADGSAIDGAKATLDGAPLGDSLDGRAVPVDPGPHDLRCEANGTVVQKHIVVAEGQKNQPFYVMMDPAPAAAPAPAPTAAATPAAAPAPAPTPAAAPAEQPAPSSGSTWHGLPTATWILGGVAAVGVVSFAVFGIMGRNVQSCAPNCTQSQVDDLRRDYLIADVSWITGLVAAGAALYFALTAPASPAPAQATAIRW